MMMNNRPDPTTLAMQGERELVVTHLFNAPLKLVWEAMTKPEHIVKWYGLRNSTMPVCEVDLRVGGKWRFVTRDPQGNDYAFSGEYKEIVPYEKVVTTEGFEAMPGHEYVVTQTFTERDGKTELHEHVVYQSAADRDGHAASGMEWGMRETFSRLDELLTQMA
jgi:uncharacterized protein YndB with AHSA1/START domain